MRVWIVSLFEPTIVDNTRPMRYMSLQNALIDAGHEVTFYSCTFRHANKKKRFEEQHVHEDDHYKTVFIEGPPYVRNFSYARVKSHDIYTDNLLRYISQEPHKPDVIVCAFPPIDTAYRLSQWATERGCKFILDIIDPWPDVIEQAIPAFALPFTKLVVWHYRKKVKEILRRIDAVVAISKQYTDWASTLARDTNFDVSVFYPSVPLQEVRAKLKKYIRSGEKKQTLSLIYAGNLGVAYDIPCIVNAFKEVEKTHPSEVQVTIAGVGHYQNLVEETASNFDNFNYLGRIGYDDLLHQYATHDIGLAQYAAGATQSVTYKLFDYLGASLPVLNSLESEMAVIVDEYKVGFNNKPQDNNQLADNIRKYLSDSSLLKSHKENALDTTKKIGDNKVVYQQFAQFISSQVSA